MGPSVAICCVSGPYSNSYVLTFGPMYTLYSCLDPSEYSRMERCLSLSLGVQLLRMALDGSGSEKFVPNMWQVHVLFHLQLMRSPMGPSTYTVNYI